MHTPPKSTPMMRIGLKKSAILSLVAITTVSTLLAGCKKPSELADEKVAADVKKAEETLADSPSNNSKALVMLSDTLKTKDATASQKAIVNMAAGHAEVMAADAAFHKIDAAQNHLERILGRVASMTADLQKNNMLIGGMTVKEPTKSLAEIDKTTTAAKTGDQGVWYPDPAAPIPALAAVDKTIADLNAKADAMKATHTDLEKQRADALAAAEKAAAQSEVAKGKLSVDLYVQAANSRKAASSLSTQLQDLDSQMAANTRELSVATAKQAQLQTALTKFADETKQVNAGWDDVKKRIDEVTAKSKAIVEAALPPPAAPDATTLPATAPSEPREAGVFSLTDAGDQIVKVSGELDRLRKDAKDHLTKADAYFADAAKLNKDVVATYHTLVTTLNESPEKPGWQWIIDIHNDYDPTLQRAQVAQRMARLYADDVYYTGSEVDIEKAAQAVLAPAAAPVKAALDAAKIELPKTLDPAPLDAGIAASKLAAEDAFKQSENYLSGIIDKLDKPGSPSTDAEKAHLEAARVTKMIEQYGHWAFLTATKGDKADVYLTTAKDLAAKLTSAETVALPLPLPPEIAPPPPNITSGLPTTATAPSDTQPATSPTTQESPTTAPATGPATPDTTPATTPAAPTDTTTPPATPTTPTTPAAPTDTTTPPATPAAPAPPPAAGTETPAPAAPAAPATPTPPAPDSK